MKTLKIIEKTKIWFIISLSIMILGLVFVIKDGLNYGIEFKGGTLVQINMNKEFDKGDVEKILKKYTNDYTTNEARDNNNNIQLEIRSNSLKDDQIKPMFNEIKAKYKLQDKDLLAQQRIGPSVGKELRSKAILSLIIANIAMLVYVGFRFEFKFGLAAILALVHDILITISVYAILQIPVNSSFIAAILTIVGYSINDTIVVFDRIRENRKRNRKANEAEVANVSITQTMKRSINTSLTTLFTIVCVYIFVPSVREFALPLLIGIVCGAYSSIFIASPLWVVFTKKDKILN
ncbi:protein translocase subunit SecF [Clostridium cochlearium]|jgi:preprotein translocase subunit SecF|uniref:Protein-export membrane protein SecF n=1 Tax=Clostridium cochlearium TaxID=1494 RepID=A0A240AR47_CLOCO|nr:protein translocase subunit SecF [Clostridium cochlearium]MBV1818919.1 protein translocase subunit SecF [Bacteroidales bacterium MSK.15.36]MCG4572080.1 protein translocase subunit SecF [Clostridium cochlearium]MCR1970816.1 protein translocase subunit SecF [Clostridium cochlearium]SNV85689.1 preprotein translocase subunit SecF [Clostridium cochlearium]SQB35456.1 preprotein translocase subunit SecF [Clostridium cochlearium]